MLIDCIFENIVEAYKSNIFKHQERLENLIIY